MTEASLKVRLGELRGRLQKGPFEGAVAQAEQLFAQYPQDPRVCEVLGLIYGRVSAVEKEQAVWRHATQLWPATPIFHFYLALLLMRQGHREAAQPALTQAFDPMPSTAPVLLYMGEMLLEVYAFSQAERCFRALLELQPDHFQGIMGLAHALLPQHGAREVVQLLKTGLAKHGSRGDMWSLLGLAYQECALVTEAVAAYRQALVCDPKHGAARNNLQMAQRYAHTPEQRLQQVAARLGASKNGSVEYGVALYQAGRFGEAKALFRRQLKAQAGGAQLHYYLALADLGLKAVDQAVLRLQRVLKAVPEHLFAQVALANIEQQAAPGARRVGLHLNVPYHYHILKSVAEACRALGMQVMVSPWVEELRWFEPDVLVVAESHASLLRHPFKGVPFVWVRHGLISKNITYLSARVSDYACLTSHASGENYTLRGGRPRQAVWITGYPQMDSLFQGGAVNIPPFIPRNHKVVLYAPTWNAALSAQPMLGQALPDALLAGRSDITVLIKPHPVTWGHHPQWIDQWRQMARAHPAIHLVDDPAADVMPYLARADLLVSDVSSVMLQFLALDRPIIVLTNPEAKQAAHYDQQGPEWQYRHVAHELFTVDELPGAITEALENPYDRAQARQAVRQDLFGDLTDGRAGVRIAQNIAAMPCGVGG
ncbi:CDP-glycerol glycerophosphotransferase family protein [Magnetococcus sp. PR-3]|uniref:CDP-glycerol glycerophosphotransferase family protein n=1 Tax=Magnetococcus sp. PR-3 TaxID=3120355 RepID=UPI002FCE36E5